jgi:hypothetical protein
MTPGSGFKWHPLGAISHKGRKMRLVRLWRKRPPAGVVRPILHWARSDDDQNSSRLIGPSPSSHCPFLSDIPQYSLRLTGPMRPPWIANTASVRVPLGGRRSWRTGHCISGQTCGLSKAARLANWARVCQRRLQCSNPSPAHPVLACPSLSPKTING